MEVKSSKFFPAYLALYILTFLIGIAGKIFRYNYFISFGYFNLFHIFMEMIFSVCAISIFLIILYSYPYEKGIRYIIPGAMFPLFAVLNTYHVFCSLDLNLTGLGYRAADITYLILAATLILSVVLPEKPSRHRSRTIVLTPLVVSLISICHIIKIKDKTVSPLLAFGHNYYQTVFYIVLEIILIAALVILYRYREKRDREQIKCGIKSLLFLILSIFYFLLFDFHNDIYSVAGHIFKAISIFYMTNSFFILYVRRPHQVMERAIGLAEESSSIKTDFIINLAHELRTPINIILNASKLIDCSEGSLKYLKSIEKGTERLSKVCESIIEFNEIENGDITYRYENLDVVFLIDEILENAEETADCKNLDIKFDFTNAHLVVTDIKKFKIVVLNLISNAIKYAPYDGSVRIGLNITEDRLYLRIVNNGPKIPKEEVNKIFQKFYKVKTSDVESTEGLGIGLYIAKGYSEMLGGHIYVVDEDGFTGYLFTLPVEKASEEIVNNVENYDVKGFFSDLS